VHKAGVVVCKKKLFLKIVGTVPTTMKQNLKNEEKK